MLPWQHYLCFLGLKYFFAVLCILNPCMLIRFSTIFNFYVGMARHKEEVVTFVKYPHHILDTKTSQNFRNTPWWRSALYECFLVDTVLHFTSLFCSLDMVCQESEVYISTSLTLILMHKAHENIFCVMTKKC